MTWSDPIVEEVRRIRDEYAARFNYDLQAIFRDLKEQEQRSGRAVVSFGDESIADKDAALIEKRRRALVGLEDSAHPTRSTSDSEAFHDEEEPRTEV